MIDALPAGSTDSAAYDGAGAAAAHGLAERLGLAATPTFAVMALLTGVLGEGPMDIFCAVGHRSPLNGMVPMYLLMSVFHSAPWLKLILGRRCVYSGHGRAAAGGAR